MNIALDPGTMRLAPRRGLRRQDAAAYVGISATKFDELVADGRMPKPFRIDACVLWDIRKLDLAIDALSDTPDEEDTWEGI
ncbi:MAG: XRE family transcriptional regulator [Bauldia sp.]|nr:XRE family transcriptional regulator [Bauldia sp.]